MSFSLPAVLECTFFYSALYLIYYYFAQYNHTLLIVSAIVLLILAWRITPYAYERGQRSFNDTLSFGQYSWDPLITWWRLFIWPISLLLSWIFHS